MVFLRSEEHVERWLAANGWEPGATTNAATLHALARRWWSTRLDRDWRPRAPAESQAILDELGLTGEFWQLTLMGQVGSIHSDERRPSACARSS